MSSQGPSVGTNDSATGNTGCFGPIEPSQVARGYAFDINSLRDASDWITYKKRQLILKELKTNSFQDPWFVHGNNYRMDYLGGKYQNGSPTGCTGCTGGAYNMDGPFTD
jgi:hypothetical protein